MLERAKAEPAQQQVEQPPIVVVDPDPDDADDDIGHQNRGEPDDPQGAGERRAGIEAERQEQPAEHVGDGADEREDGGVPDRLPEDLVGGQQLREVAEPDEMADAARPDDVEAVEDRAGDRVEGKNDEDEQRRRDEQQDGAARGLAGGLAGPPAPLGFNRRQRPLALIPRDSVYGSDAAAAAAVSSVEKQRT